MQAKISLGVQTARLRKKGIITDGMADEEILQCTLQARAEAKERVKLIRRQKLEASQQVCTFAEGALQGCLMDKTNPEAVSVCILQCHSFCSRQCQGLYFAVLTHAAGKLAPREAVPCRVDNYCCCTAHLRLLPRGAGTLSRSDIASTCRMTCGGKSKGRPKRQSARLRSS